jgi:hypothetical protein
MVRRTRSATHFPATAALAAVAARVQQRILALGATPETTGLP